MSIFSVVVGNKSPKTWSHYSLTSSIRNIGHYLLETEHALMRFDISRLTISPQPKVSRLSFITFHSAALSARQ